jgi:peptidoglycan hydrolase CwlO-like protein
MSIRKRKLSASDVLRQEMQQPQEPLVLPDRENSPQPNNSTPTTNMTQPNNDSSATTDEAKLKKQIEELQSKLEAQSASSQKMQEKADSLTKELKDASETIVKLAAQSKTPAPKVPAKNLLKTDISPGARPVQSREETALRRANTDIGWLD